MTDSISYRPVEITSTATVAVVRAELVRLAQQFRPDIVEEVHGAPFGLVDSEGDDKGVTILPEDFALHLAGLKLSLFSAKMWSLTPLYTPPSGRTNDLAFPLPDEFGCNLPHLRQTVTNELARLERWSIVDASKVKLEVKEKTGGPPRVAYLVFDEDVAMEYRALTRVFLNKVTLHAAPVENGNNNNNNNNNIRKNLLMQLDWKKRPYIASTEWSRASPPKQTKQRVLGFNAAVKENLQQNKLSPTDGVTTALAAAALSVTPCNTGVAKTGCDEAPPQFKQALQGAWGSTMAVVPAPAPVTSPAVPPVVPPVAPSVVAKGKLNPNPVKMVPLAEAKTGPSKAELRRQDIERKRAKAEARVKLAEEAKALELANRELEAKQEIERKQAERAAKKAARAAEYEAKLKTANKPAVVQSKNKSSVPVGYAPVEKKVSILARPPAATQAEAQSVLQSVLPEVPVKEVPVQVAPSPSIINFGGADLLSHQGKLWDMRKIKGELDMTKNVPEIINFGGFDLVSYHGCVWSLTVLVTA